MTELEWEDVFAVDLKSAWLAARAVLPAMKAAKTGAIVNIASLHAEMTYPGMFPYAAAKSGLVGLTRSLALELGPWRIRVNALSPGYVETALVGEFFDRNDPALREKVLDAHPMRRMGSPAEIANCAVFLISDEASFVTGANWRVDGGLGARFAGSEGARRGRYRPRARTSSCWDRRATLTGALGRSRRFSLLIAELGEIVRAHELDLAAGEAREIGAALSVVDARHPPGESNSHRPRAAVQLDFRAQSSASSASFPT